MKKIIRRFFFAVGLGSLYGFAASAKAMFLLFITSMWRRLIYWKIRRRIRSYPTGRKIRVFFWVAETAKWKSQSLYDKMLASEDFDPYVLLGVPKDDLHFWGDGIKEKLELDSRFYARLGCRCIVNFQFDVMRPRPLKEFNPDIVFYQESRKFFDEDSVNNASNTALCCYVPYSVETFGLLWIHIQPQFHGRLYLRVAPTEADARYIKSYSPWWRRTGDVKGLGHTVFDEYLNCIAEEAPSDYVIYAPHFSFPTEKKNRPIVISSFLATGKAILEYAKAHREFKWLFKPHPLLRRELEICEVWSRAEIDEYYEGWERIGVTEYQGDYVRLFKQSRLLITDCSSFLVEYALTNNPVIRLVPKEINVSSRPAYASLFETYYTVHSLNEMYSTFAQVLEQGEDPKREERLNAVRELGLMGGKTSAERIMEKLRRVCRRNEVTR